MARVLVVAADPEIAARAQAMAAAEGHTVVTCGGPHRPTFICAGGRGEPCPLTQQVDAVIVDGWLDSDAARCGVPSDHLVLYYRGLGIPVLALVGPNGLPGRLVDQGIHAIARHASASEFRYALRDLLDGVNIRRRITIVATTRAPS